jgi:hypothetical protein
MTTLAIAGEYLRGWIPLLVAGGTSSSQKPAQQTAWRRTKR